MRKAILLSSMIFHAMLILAQMPVDEQEDFRTAAREHFADKTAALNEIFMLTDSMDSKQAKIYIHTLDSMALDSVNGSFNLPLIEMSRHFYHLIHGNTAMASAALKKAQPFFDLSETQDQFKFRMNKYAAGYFESTGDIAYALTARKRLSQAYELLYESSLAEWKGSTDSLTKIESQLSKELEKHQETATHDRSVFMQAIAGAGIIILILLVILFLSRWSLKKKLKASLNKPRDTSETDILNARIQELNNEVTQYKHTAQLTINKLNNLDASNRKVTQSIAHMKEEVAKVLDEINTQNEQQKSNASPASYMLVRNTISRTASVVDEQVKQILSLLK